jgi:hypothetical protein
VEERIAHQEDRTSPRHGRRTYRFAAMTSTLPTDAFAAADFIDLGASNGGSLRYCQNRFGGRGVGIDIDPGKVARARAAGFDVVCADAANLRLVDGVDYVSAMDFFEHLPSLAETRAILRSALLAARDFVFIRHPSFENEAYLREHGLCQYWHDWSGHPNHVTVADWCALFAELAVPAYAVEHVGRIEHSSHESILPVGHRNQHQYDQDLHGPKPDVAFSKPVWRMQHLYVAAREPSPKLWAAVIGGARVYQRRR